MGLHIINKRIKDIGKVICLENVVTKIDRPDAIVIRCEGFTCTGKALDKDVHYQRAAKGRLEQCNYNNVYLKNNSDKEEEIIIRVHEASDDDLKGLRLVSPS